MKLIFVLGCFIFGIVFLVDEFCMKEFGGFIFFYNGGEIIDWSIGEIVYVNVLLDEVIFWLYECVMCN